MLFPPYSFTRERAPLTKDKGGGDHLRVSGLVWSGPSVPIEFPRRFISVNPPNCTYEFPRKCISVNPHNCTNEFPLKRISVNPRKFFLTLALNRDIVLSGIR